MKSNAVISSKRYVSKKKCKPTNGWYKVKKHTGESEFTKSIYKAIKKEGKK